MRSCYCRGQSTTTRIETFHRLFQQLRVVYCRGQSTTTRIETMHSAQSQPMLVLIAEANPLQQGLKQCFTWFKSRRQFNYCRGQSTTTRIETEYWKAARIPNSRLQRPIHYNKDWNEKRWFQRRILQFIAEANPLQQGLKLLSKVFSATEFERLQRPIHYNKDWNKTDDNIRSSWSVIAEANPLQQGLKQSSCNFTAAGCTNCRGQSTTTRIETKTQQPRTMETDRLQRPIHYNKDWN